MSDSTMRGLGRVWSIFVAEARTLSTTPAQDMSADQLDRLDEVSDAFIHVAGRARARAGAGDALLERELSRRRDPRPRPPAGQAERPGALDVAERSALRARILSALQAGRLRVRESEPAPHRRSIGASRAVTPSLLRDAGLAHQAVVVSEMRIAAGAGRELWDVDCDAVVDVPADLPRGAYVVLQVAGDSMEPLLRGGDLVLVRLSTSAARGTVVVARDPEHGYVVKEVGCVTADGLELLSLNPRYAPLTVPHGNGVVLGTVVLRWRPREATS